MLLGYIALLLIIIILVIGIYKHKKNTKEHFLILNDQSIYVNPQNTTSPLNPLNTLNPSITSDNTPVEIKHQIPVTANQLSDTQLKSIDTDVLRNVRTLANFSMTDEFDFYQVYSILKNFKNQTYNFNYEPLPDNKKSKILDSEKLIAINSGAINNTDLELFSRLKLELISVFNSIIIKNGLFIPYHPYQFFKIINSNMISNTKIDNTKNNFVFTVTFAREYKFQQFVIYYDVDLVSNGNQYTVTTKKVELIGIPIPNTIEFHPNQKTKTDSNTNSITDSITDSNTDFYYQDQVSDSSKFDVMPSGDPSVRNKSPSVKYIDITETNDIDNTMFDKDSLSTKIEDRIMNVSRDQQFNNKRCFGLVNGISKELPQYKNPIFCKSFHPEINQNGVWDAPCQVNNDCPFYKSNKNYPNEFGKCNKVSGQCEMPLGVIPLGFTKYGKIEPNCYNCGSMSLDSKCCNTQLDSIKSGLVNYKSPDYVFAGDESNRKQFENDLKTLGLLVNPSI